MHVNRSLDRSRTSCARVLGYFNERERGRARPIDYTAGLAAEINNPLYVPSFSRRPRDVNAADTEAARSAIIGEYSSILVFALGISRLSEQVILQSLIIAH